MQPRASWNSEQLEELANSIVEHGVIQPLIVTRSMGNTPYSIIAGERRWRAAKLAGLSTVPVLIREATSQQTLELAIVENVQRSDLNAIEEALAFRHLVDEFGLTQSDIARRVGKSRSAIANTLRLLDAAPEIRQAIVDELISAGHGRALLGFDSDELQVAALEKVVQEKLSVRQTEEHVRKSSGPAPAKTRKVVARNPEIENLERQLRTTLGTTVQIHPSASGGNIIIHYFSDEELSALAAKILESAE